MSVESVKPSRPGWLETSPLIVIGVPVAGLPVPAPHLAVWPLVEAPAGAEDAELVATAPAELLLVLVDPQAASINARHALTVRLVTPVRRPTRFMFSPLII